MKYTFLISSAINTKFGVYKAEERMSQTLDTINSIKNKVENPQIILAEMSGAGITSEQVKIISDQVTYLVDFTVDPTVTKLYNATNNWDIVKNGTEINCFIKLLKVCNDRKLFEGYNRIFKISGRYVLTDDFDISFYEQPDVLNKIVVGGKKKSQFPIEVTQQSWQYMSRLWSWPSESLIEVMQVYADGANYFSERHAAGGYVDIEHILAKFLNSEHVIEHKNLGIAGNISPTGLTVKD
jgi:hypothetical protein